jgi:hypothetical protein
MILILQALKQLNITLNTDINMYDKKLVANIADNIIEEVNEHIDNTIHWQLDPSEFQLNEFDDLYELELQVKQQLLFSLIKKVTK